MSLYCFTPDSCPVCEVLPVEGCDWEEELELIEESDCEEVAAAELPLWLGMDSLVAAAPGVLVVGLVLFCPMVLELELSGELVVVVVMLWLVLLVVVLVGLLWLMLPLLSGEVVEALPGGGVVPLVPEPQCSEIMRTSLTCTVCPALEVPVVPVVLAVL
jgi:hypothetical protein